MHFTLLVRLRVCSGLIVVFTELVSFFFISFMASSNQDVDDLSSKISNLGWDEFHTLLNPTSHEDDMDIPAIVGKIHANRTFAPSVVMSTMKAAWSFIREFSTEEMAPNIFLFKLSSMEDQEQVLTQTPWNVRGHIMVVKPWSPELTLPEVDFFSKGMWVQAHGLLWNRVNASSVQLMGFKLGKLLEIDKFDYRDQDGKPFLRIRVELNLPKPMVGGFPIPRRQFKPLWV